MREIPDLPSPAPADTPGYTLVKAAIFCGECLGWHERLVWAMGTRLADPLCIGAGLGAGWVYALSPQENHGLPDGLMVPVYRPVRRIADDLVAGLLGAGAQR